MSEPLTGEESQEGLFSTPENDVAGEPEDEDPEAQAGEVLDEDAGGEARRELEGS